MDIKKLILLPIITVCLVLCTSCLTSLQPLVTPDKIITDDRITGTWKYNDQVVRIENLSKSKLAHNLNNSILGNMNGALSISDKQDSVFYSKTYDIAFEKKGITYHMLGALTRINNRLFIDLMPAVIEDPAHPDNNGYDFNINYLNTCSMARLEIRSGNELSIQFLNGDFIKTQIVNDRIRIRHNSDDLSGTILITASSAELQQFIEKYSHDERLFSKENSITLTRKG